eukprot:TRINITY_DN4726_c0_g1_i2.p1 TRINITY_DN4726_c0_g1~~TRINITY_DN4726_c0_g1_i2.p1  ORF type:complete len:159 (+),score=34.76 TRINITY_DN4726_c0_g1_i2:648-1124(+)
MDDGSYCKMFDSVFTLVFQNYQPDVIVVQCGADGLAGDPHGGFNLTPASLSHCVNKVAKSGPPVLVLGGGGYNIPNTVRCWVRVTADLLDFDLPQDIPDSDPYFLEYGPDFTFSVTPSNIKNPNTDEELKEILTLLQQNLDKMNENVPMEPASVATVI